MKVTQEEWKRKHENLVQRRSEGTSSISNEYFPTYGDMLAKCFVGKSVLDVGCGSCDLKKWLSKDTEYVGIDAFPYDDRVAPFSAEDLDDMAWKYETITAFAMLDNVLDLQKSISGMKKTATKNIIILTGVCIPVNEYHTLEIAEDTLDALFNDWKHGYREMIAPKLLLKEYLR